MIEIERCPNCNANLAMVGRSHRCVPMPGWAGGAPKSSDGIAEGREAQDRRKAKRVAPDCPPLEVGAVAQMGERGPSQGLRSEVQTLSAPVGTKAGPSEAKAKRSPRGSFDRKVYQRELMRKRRKKEQAK